MKQSALFTKTLRAAPGDEITANAIFLIRGGFIDKLMAGVYSYLPLGWRVLKKIENVIREEINTIDGQEVFMPSLQPKENWEKTGRWLSMDDLYKVKDSGGREYALGPTHEEVVVPLVQKFINSYKDFPFYVYQFQNKFRMELRSKSGILRGREFIMKDLYSFHLSEADLEDYYRKATQAYFNIFRRVGLGEKTYLTFASGNSFSKYSHEFQTVTSAGEDIIHICQKCAQAINDEIKSEIKECSNCGCDKFKTARAIEVGNIFKLKDRYTNPFNLVVKDKNGKNIKAIMGCYGIGLGRVMGAIVELHHDEDGIIWPSQVAPFLVHLIGLGGARNEAEKVYSQLKKSGTEVLFDDRDVSAGEKFKDADLIGIPFRVVVSEKTIEKNKAEIKKRSEKEIKLVNLNDVQREVGKTQ